VTEDTDIIALRQPHSVDDPLTEIAREGARRMLAAALRAEADAFVEELAADRLPDGRQRVVRHGYGPEREIQTGIIENLLLPTYRAVLERGKLDGSPEEKAALLAFMAFQFTRTRAQRDLFDTMEAHLNDQLVKMGASIEDSKATNPQPTSPVPSSIFGS
jgi:hypothetical protein